MGKKARGRRKKEKALFGKVLRLQRWKENEFGELSQRMTKAEARRLLLARHFAFRRAEREIVERMCLIARDEICAIEDERVLGEISRAVEALPPP